MGKDSELQRIDVIDRRIVDQVVNAIQSVIAGVPTTDEAPSADPARRAARIATVASTKAAALASTLALPPGPLGILTIIPDLIGIWRIQQQMVADIAGAFGKQAALSREQMLYCLFRHAAGQAVRDIVVRVGQRVLIRKASLQVMQTALRKIGIRVTQRVIGRALSRWVPVAGAVGVGAYAFFDTRQVGKTAIALFSQDVDLEAQDDPMPRP
jgi:hypothetical protein